MLMVVNGFQETYRLEWMPRTQQCRTVRLWKLRGRLVYLYWTDISENLQQSLKTSDLIWWYKAVMYDFRDLIETWKHKNLPYEIWKYKFWVICTYSGVKAILKYGKFWTKNVCFNVLNNRGLFHKEHTLYLYNLAKWRD